jgi:hypothetical protein
MIDTPEYLATQQRLAKGWNTWDTRSLLCWVNLPSGIALNLGIKSFAGINNHLRSVQVGEQDVQVGRHAYNGRYTELELTHINTSVSIKTATVEDDLVVLVEPVCTSVKKSLVVAEIGLLWNRPGTVKSCGDAIEAETADCRVCCYPAGAKQEDPQIHAMGPYLALSLSESCGFSTGKPRSLADIQSIVDDAGRNFASSCETGEETEIRDAIQTCTAWDTIYEPAGKRVITTVSRWWNDHRYGGYALFCWDTFFAGVLASLDHPDLAHANAIEILREATDAGFVPNVTSGSGRNTLDRSQPPVGAISVLYIYQRLQQKWFLEQTFETLWKWNTWWTQHRMQDGYLCWGSEPYDPVVGDRREIGQQNTRFGAALESGLDNSPMYDEMPFDTQESHLMQLADVGLMSLYIADCKSLAEIADEIGYCEQRNTLMNRAELVSQALQSLWSEEHGIFLNKRLDTGALSLRLSPTNFYPMLAGVPTEAQATRMIQEHFMNPEEFWGEWIIPSIARNDPAYAEQDYWRGRIWAPMNWLVYLGLCNYPSLEHARKALAAKSKSLFLREWRNHRHIHENYNSDTGEGCDVENSDPFYHWGCLLGLIALHEEDMKYDEQRTNSEKV